MLFLKARRRREFFFGLTSPPWGRPWGRSKSTAPPWGDPWGGSEKKLPPSPWGGSWIPGLGILRKNSFSERKRN